MLASSQQKNPLLKKKKHERIGRKCFTGADPDGRGANWPGRAQLRYLFAVAQGPHRFYRHAHGRSHCQSRYCPTAVTAGLAVYDTMQFLTCDVTTYCLGMAASMAAVLLCAGTKGKRFALPNSD